MDFTGRGTNAPPCASVRPCRTMIPWETPGSLGYQGHASGHRRPRSQHVPQPPRQAARRNSPEHPRGPPSGMGSPSGTYRSPLRPFALRRSLGSPHASEVQGDTPEQAQETRNSGRSRRRRRTPPPAARQVVLHEVMDRDHGVLCDPDAQRTSSTTNPRRRSKRPRTERTHIPTILTPVERGRQATLHANPLPGGGRSIQVVPRLPPRVSGQLTVGGTTGHGHATKGASGRPKLCARSGATPPPAAPKPPNHRGHIAATRARRERPKGGHRNDRDLRPSGVPWPTARRHPLLGAPATGTLHGIRAWRTPWHHLTAPLPGWRRLDHDRVAMPPAPPQPPQQRGTGPFDDAELRALYGIRASKPSNELLATLREHLSGVDPNRLFAVVPLPHAATTENFLRQLQVPVTPGARVSDDVVEAWIWWFNTRQPAQGGVLVPHLGWAHMLIAPPMDPRPAPGTGSRERAAPPPRPETLRIPPYEGLAAWESGIVRSRGHNLTSLAACYPVTART